MAINDFNAGWLPEVPNKVKSRGYMKEIMSLELSERNARLVNLFLDIQAVLKNPNITPQRVSYLRNLRARVLKILPVDIKEQLRSEEKSWKLARKTLIKRIPRRTKKQRFERWENFISEDDPRRENKAFLYDLDGVSHDRIREVFNDQRRGLVPVKKQSEWLVHVSNVRARNPGISYKDALKLASESFIKQPPKQKVSTVLQKRVRKPRARKPRVRKPTKAQLASQVKSLSEKLASLGIPLPEGSRRLDEPLLFPDFVSSPSKSPPKKQARTVRRLPDVPSDLIISEAKVLKRKPGRPRKAPITYAERVKAYRAANPGATITKARNFITNNDYDPELGYGSGILRKIGNSRVFKKLKNIVY